MGGLLRSSSSSLLTIRDAPQVSQVLRVPHQRAEDYPPHLCFLEKASRTHSPTRELPRPTELLAGAAFHDSWIYITTWHSGNVKITAI